jgi:hypothetical protein
MEVLQTSALPLGYAAVLIDSYQKMTCIILASYYRASATFLNLGQLTVSSPSPRVISFWHC